MPSLGQINQPSLGQLTWLSTASSRNISFAFHLMNLFRARPFLSGSHIPFPFITFHLQTSSSWLRSIQFSFASKPSQITFYTARFLFLYHNRLRHCTLSRTSAEDEDEQSDDKDGSDGCADSNSCFCSCAERC